MAIFFKIFFILKLNYYLSLSSLLKSYYDWGILLDLLYENSASFIISDDFFSSPCSSLN